MILIEFWNTHDIGNVMYDLSQSFRQKVFIDINNIGYKYNLTETGRTVDGKFFPELSVSYKTATINFKAPEYLVEALESMILCDHKFIDGDEIGSIKMINGVENNGLINVSMEIIVNVVIKSPLNTGRAMLSRQYLKIGDNHNLLIGGGNKLLIQDE